MEVVGKTSGIVEALLYERLEEDRVKCGVCPRRCVIENDKRGYCFTRENKKGKLYSLIYGQVASISVNPIEKKPVFHFYPGSRWLSVGSLGCNFRCPGCQNWEISHAKPGEGVRQTDYISPEELVALAKKYNCLGISWTFNEPALWLEYALAGARLAKEQDLYTNYVTNGYMTQEALDVIGPYLDVFRVDLKGFSATSYNRIGHITDFSPILEATKSAKYKWGMHVEVVTNVIPGFNDDEDELEGIANWICAELGCYTPWHLTRFYPHLELSQVSTTPIITLEKARQKAYEGGLKYVYIGNVPGHPAENTYCHQCQQLLIERYVFDVAKYRIKDGCCPDCGVEIPGKFT